MRVKFVAVISDDDDIGSESSFEGTTRHVVKSGTNIMTKCLHHFILKLWPNIEKLNRRNVLQKSLFINVERTRVCVTG